MSDSHWLKLNQFIRYCFCSFTIPWPSLGSCALLLKNDTINKNGNIVISYSSASVMDQFNWAMPQGISFVVSMNNTSEKISLQFAQHRTKIILVNHIKSNWKHRTKCRTKINPIEIECHSTKSSNFPFIPWPISKKRGQTVNFSIC